KLSVSLGDNLKVASTTGQIRTFKILGIFRTGRSEYDESHTFAAIKRVQALLDRPNRANTVIMKLPQPTQARAVAQGIERRIGYKTVSWQEASEDIMSTLAIRNIIMYTVVSAVLVVAGFGIYNVISTVVMEKHRDIAILKSMGFTARDVQRVFVIQGTLLGLAGIAAGLPLGSLLMFGLGQVQLKPPGSTEMVQLPIDWGAMQFLIAAAFAMASSVMAAFLPARKAARVKPVDILRGSGG
ncbi:MAG: ABC transporter permease, partial [Alphaproteobacteria bacterium]|nr:ABC transporter permease [Alphaproteobacteria bacterium]